MTGPAASTFAIGFRAYHVHGVEHAGNGDGDSFMWQYGIGWQRGLNGNSGALGPAPSGGNNHTDVGERSEEHTSELQSLMRLSSAVFCLKKKKKRQQTLN